MSCDRRKSCCCSLLFDESNCALQLLRQLILAHSECRNIVSVCCYRVSVRFYVSLRFSLSWTDLLVSLRSFGKFLYGSYLLQNTLGSLWCVTYIIGLQKSKDRSFGHRNFHGFHFFQKLGFYIRSIGLRSSSSRRWCFSIKKQNP